MDSSDERQATLCHLCQCAKWHFSTKSTINTDFFLYFLYLCHLAHWRKWHKWHKVATIYLFCYNINCSIFQAVSFASQLHTGWLMAALNNHLSQAIECWYLKLMTIQLIGMIAA